MKIFKILSIAILCVIVLVVIIGYSTPDLTYINKIEVNKPVDKAWAIFDNEENMAKWMKGFKSIEPISGEPNQPGSTFKLITSEGGKDVTITEEVVKYVKHEEYAFKFYNDEVSGTASIEFSPLKDGTSITAKHMITGKGLFLKAVMPFFKSSMKSQGQDNYNNLKELIDNS